MNLTSKNKHYIYIAGIFIIIIAIIFINYIFLFKNINKNRIGIGSLRQEIDFLEKKMQYIHFIQYEKERVQEIKDKLSKIKINYISPTPLEFLYNLEKIAQNTNNEIEIQIQEDDSTQFKINLIGYSYKDLIDFVQKIEKLGSANIKLHRISKIIDKIDSKNEFKLKSDLTIYLKKN